jgi:hypothetical protein
MRTTLDIEDAVLVAVKELARRERRTAGEVASELIRRALTQPLSVGVQEQRGLYGFRPFAAGGDQVTNEQVTNEQVTNEQVNRLRDDLGV